MKLNSDAKIEPCDLGVSKIAFGELDGISLEHCKV